MASSGPDRSIGGMSYFPQWMKSKINDRYDLEQTMAFSPPNTDDGFFLLKYKRHEEPTNQPKIVEAKFTPKLQTFDETPNTPVSTTATTTLAASALKQFIATDTTPREVGMRHPGEQSLTKIKSSSEDTKESSPPFGSSSIVSVAHQMIADKNHETPASDNLLVPPRLRVRRNSKSLPASPQTSPKILRKNPFFTNIFFGSSELVNVSEESHSVTRTVSTEDTRLDSWSSRVARAFSDADSAPTATKVPQTAARVPQTAATAAVKALKAKPSELREMNFWSPTSM